MSDARKKMYKKFENVTNNYFLKVYCINNITLLANAQQQTIICFMM